MWEKRFNYRDGEVLFTAAKDGRVRELRFIQNVCIDSTYASNDDFRANRAEQSTTYDLASPIEQMFGPSDRFDGARPLEVQIQTSNFDFQLPGEYVR